jgi:hypothetical protein
MRYFGIYRTRAEILAAVQAHAPRLMESACGALQYTKAGVRAPILMRFAAEDGSLRYRETGSSDTRCPVVLPEAVVAALVSEDDVAAMRREAARWREIMDRPPPFPICERRNGAHPNPSKGE